MMLRFIGEVAAADKIEKAVEAVLKEGKYLTCDLGGNTGTREFADVIIEKMR
jgi:isocitrate dehydrogenase (NAD+)